MKKSNMMWWLSLGQDTRTALGEWLRGDRKDFVDMSYSDRLVHLMKNFREHSKVEYYELLFIWIFERGLLTSYRKGLPY